jgi:hypothetical protein
MTDDILDSAADDLADAKAKIVATRKALVAVPENPTVRHALAQLDRLVVELVKVEQAVNGQAAHPAKA